MDKRIRQAYDFIKKNYRQKLLLRDLADLVELSPFHFQRLFTREMNESPAQCINRVRLERAVHWLHARQEISMTEVATDCGFSSLATFSRAFSKTYGMPPALFYRAAHPDDVPLSSAANSNVWDVKIEYFPDMHIYYTHTSVFHEQLLDDFKSALSFCELAGIHDPSKKMIGVLTYLTIHSPRRNLNYYAGVQLAKNAAFEHLEKTFFIPEGKYACIVTDASLQNLTEFMTAWKAEWLDHSPYAIRDLFGFEIIDPATQKGDYPFFRRKICMPVRYK